MEYVNLGNTGLRVSRVCLGMMSFGAHDERPWALDEADGRADRPRARSRAASRSSTPPTSTTAARARSSPAGSCRELFGTREEYVVATKVLRPDDARRERPRARRASTSSPRSTRRSAARPRLRRPLPDPPLGRPHADRGDDGGAARRRARGQGALHRREQHVRLAVREGAGGRGAQRLDAVRLDAEPLQPRLPRGGAGDDPAVRRPGRRRDPVEPARARPARRQPHARAASG